MEELENALNSNNPILIAQIFSKVIKNIKEKYKVGNKDSPELTFLKNKCLVQDSSINEVAGITLINLVKDGTLPIDTTLADFITSIPLTKCYKSLINIIGNLLCFEMAAKIDIHKTCINEYNLWLPQHPYITILNENPDVWNHVLNEIRCVSDKENSEYVTEIFRPVYLYALCNPVPTSRYLLKQNIWNFILSRKNLDKRILFDIFGLMQVETKNNLEASSELLSEALNVASYQSVYNLEIIILWQTAVLYNLALNKLDLRLCISSLKRIVKDIDHIATINCLLLILTKTLPICSSVYLLDLLNLCNFLLSYDGKQTYILESLKASLLQWLAGPSILTADANQIAQKMFMYIEMYNDSFKNDLDFETFVHKNKRLISTNKTVFASIEICLLLTHLKEENSLLKWIASVERGPPCLTTDLYNFLCGLFLSNKLQSDVVIKIFELLVKNVEANNMLSTQLLTLILYKLSNTTCPNLHFMLLKAFPKMVMLRDNIPKVMGVLQTLSKTSVDLYNFSLSLTFEVWKADNKCYSYLENMLIQSRFPEKKWDTYVTKSFILKELCERKPELYGKEIVAHLSKILNECNDDAGSLPCAIAIDGIRILCKSEVIDAVTTWTTLAPKFKDDARVPVIKSLCSLLHEIPHLPYAESNVALQEEIVKTLWDYVQIGTPEITEAALNSLTSFSLEQICSQLPEQYLENNTIQERKRTAVGIPQTVPGNTWVKFLIENRAYKEAGDFIIKMISIEVAGYLKYVYQVKGHREPINYDYLPTHSIVRGIGEFIKTWATKWKHSIHDLLYIECLRIFSKGYSKPLPPLNWCFLQELLHDIRIKNYCIDIASHQAILSGTARRLVENYIVAVTENLQDDDIMNVLRNFKYLANSIQPLILKPFFEKAIAFSISKYESGEKSLLEKILEFIREVLQNPEIQETNKITIADVLSDRILIVDIKSELFDILLKCVIMLPKKCVDEITNLKSDVSKEWLEKVTKIRCSIASNTKVAPLLWLNEVIEVSSSIERNNFIVNEFVKVFRKHVNNPSECALWLLELIGQTQSKVAERCDEGQMSYYFDLLILTIVEFSGFSTFIITDENLDHDVRRKELFPQAFNALLSMNDWSVCTSQALEWLFHMNAEETVPSEYRNLFGLTLWSLRHDEEFLKNLRWMKYLSSKAVVDII